MLTGRKRLNVGETQTERQRERERERERERGKREREKHIYCQNKTDRHTQADGDCNMVTFTAEKGWS